MTVSQRIFLAVAQLAPSHPVLTRSGDVSDRAENSNVYVRAEEPVVGALD